MELAIILAIISFFAAKKSGMSSEKAALTGAAVGLGSYWVQENTEWGQQTLKPISQDIGEALGLRKGDVAEDGTVTDSDGKVIPVPPGHTAVKQPDGSVAFIKKSGGLGNMLTPVLAAGAGAAVASDESWMLWLAAGAVAIAVLK